MHARARPIQPRARACVQAHSLTPPFPSPTPDTLAPQEPQRYIEGIFRVNVAANGWAAALVATMPRPDPSVGRSINTIVAKNRFRLYCTLLAPDGSSGDVMEWNGLLKNPW